MHALAQSDERKECAGTKPMEEIEESCNADNGGKRIDYTDILEIYKYCKSELQYTPC